MAAKYTFTATENIYIDNPLPSKVRHPHSNSEIFRRSQTQRDKTFFSKSRTTTDIENSGNYNGIELCYVGQRKNLNEDYGNSTGNTNKTISDSNSLPSRYKDQLYSTSKKEHYQSNDESRNDKYNIQTKSYNKLLYEIPLEKTDTLHSIALKYHCSIWELKKLNHLWGTQEIYAKPSLVIPASENSYRAELLQSVGRRVLSGSQEELDLSRSSDKIFDKPSTSSDGDFRSVSLSRAMSEGDDCYRFLRTLDADLEKIKQGTCFLKDSLDDVTSYLSSTAIRPPPHKTWAEKLGLTSDLGGLSWRGILLIFFLIGILLPLAIFMFLRFRHHHHHT